MSQTFAKVFAGVVVLVFAVAVFDALDFAGMDRGYPLLLAGVGLVLGVVVFAQEIRAKPVSADQPCDVVDIAVDDTLLSRAAYKRAAKLLGWLLSLYLGIWLIGFKIAFIVWFVLFIRLQGKVRWVVTIGLTGLIVYLIFGHFDKLLGIYWPEGLLKQ